MPDQGDGTAKNQPQAKQDVHSTEAVWVRAFYECPRCGHRWMSVWDSATDEECPECDLRDITPFHSEEDDDN